MLQKNSTGLTKKSHKICPIRFQLQCVAAFTQLEKEFCCRISSWDRCFLWKNSGEHEVLVYIVCDFERHQDTFSTEVHPQLKRRYLPYFTGVPCYYCVSIYIASIVHRMTLKASYKLFWALSLHLMPMPKLPNGINLLMHNTCNDKDRGTRAACSSVIYLPDFCNLHTNT